MPIWSANTSWELEPTGDGRCFKCSPAMSALPIDVDLQDLVRRADPARVRRTVEWMLDFIERELTEDLSRTAMHRLRANDPGALQAALEGLDDCRRACCECEVWVEMEAGSQEDLALAWRTALAAASAVVAACLALQLSLARSDIPPSVFMDIHGSWLSLAVEKGVRDEKAQHQAYGELLHFSKNRLQEAALLVNSMRERLEGPLEAFAQNPKETAT